MTVSNDRPVWHVVSGAPGSPTGSFLATVTSAFEVAPYYYRHFTDTVTVERVVATPDWTDAAGGVMVDEGLDRCRELECAEPH